MQKHRAWEVGRRCKSPVSAQRTGITRGWWNSLCDWRAAIAWTVQERCAGTRQGTRCFVKDHPRFLEMFDGIGKLLSGSLWVACALSLR